METKNITIVARVLAETEKSEIIKQELFKLIEPSRLEEGCISYNLYQDNENKNLFVVVENWEDVGAWEKHMETSHLVEYMKATEGAVADLVINKMTPVE